MNDYATDYYVTPDIKDSDIEFAAESVARYLKQRNLETITTENVIEKLRSLSNVWDEYWSMGLRTRHIEHDFLYHFMERLRKYGIADIVDNTY